MSEEILCKCGHPDYLHDKDGCDYGDATDADFYCTCRKFRRADPAYPTPDHWLTAQAEAGVPEAAALREQMDAMRDELEKLELGRALGIEKAYAEGVRDRQQSYASGARDGQLAERQANEATVAELHSQIEKYQKFVSAYDNRYSKDKDSFVKVLEAREKIESESAPQ